MILQCGYVILLRTEYGRTMLLCHIFKNRLWYDSLRQQLSGYCSHPGTRKLLDSSSRAGEKWQDFWYIWKV